MGASTFIREAIDLYIDLFTRRYKVAKHMATLKAVIDSFS